MIGSRILVVLVLLILTGIASGLTHVLDYWTVPVQNEVAMAQLNGGDAEWVTTRSMNEFLGHIQSWTWPSFACIGLLVVGCHVKKEVDHYKKLGNQEKKGNVSS